MYRRLLTTCLLLLVLAAPAFAQGASDAGTSAPPPAAPPVPAAFVTPADTLRTFLSAMSEDPPDRDRAVQCMDLSGVVEEAGPDLASWLYRSLNRIEWFELDTDYRLGNAHRTLDNGVPQPYVLFPREPLASTAWRDRMQYERAVELADGLRIVLAPDVRGAWRFDAETVEHVEELWSRLSALPTVTQFTGEEVLTLAERLESMWPAYFVEGRLLSVKYWQWLSLFAVVLAGVILDFLVRALIATIARRSIARRGGEVRHDTIRRMVRPFGLATASILWLWAILALGLSPAALKVLVPAVRLFFMLAMVWAAFRVTDLLGEMFANKAARTGTRFDDLLVPLVRKAIKIFIFVFGLIYIAESLNVPLAPLLTGLGIGGAGFAFAAKDTIEHFFGSITVIADHPFQVGDWVVMEGVEGTVESVGFRSSRVRTFYNSLVTIPNGNLVRAVVDNYGQRKYRRWKTHLNLTYDTTPERVEAFCEGIREFVRLHPYTRKDYYQVWLHQFGAHSIDVLVYMFFEAPDWQTELRERHRLMLDILRLADHLGVEFAFPTQTLHVFREEHQEGHDPAALPPRTPDPRAARSGRLAARAVTASAEWREGKPEPYRFTMTSDEDGEQEEDGATQIESKIGGDAG